MTGREKELMRKEARCKWEMNELNRIHQLKNASILGELLDLAKEYYYDGEGLSDEQTYTYDNLEEELYKRLGEWMYE